MRQARHRKPTPHGLLHDLNKSVEVESRMKVTRAFVEQEGVGVAGQGTRVKTNQRLGFERCDRHIRGIIVSHNVLQRNEP